MQKNLVLPNSKIPIQKKLAKRTKQGLNIGTEDIRWLEDYSIYDAKVLQLAVLGSQLGMVGRFQVMHGEEVSKKRIFYIHETGLQREVAETLIYFTVRAS